MGQRKNAKGGANGVFKGSQLKRFTDGSKRERSKDSKGPQFEVTGTHVVILVGALFALVMIRRALGAAPTSTNLRVLDFPRPGSYK
jgi:hypothetical protein